MTQSRTPMPVFSSRESDLLQLEKELGVLTKERKPIKSDSVDYQIISYAQKIDYVDPLAVFHKLETPEKLHFYWENTNQNQAMIAWGKTEFLVVKSPGRFAQSQDFIQSCLKKVIRKGDSSLPYSSPHFFCLFSFFSNLNYQENHPFPPATIFLPQWQIVKKNKTCTLVYNLAIDKEENIQLAVEEIEKKVNSINWKTQEFFELQNTAKTSTQTKITTDTSTEFKLAVNSALKSIKKDEFSKIVIAHATDVVSNKPFNIIDSLNNLRQLHPDCYIFSTSNGEGKIFLGASPERLISIKNQQLVTDALAGSAPRGKNTVEDTKLANLLLKSRKEKREHKAVSDYINQRLKRLGLTPQELPLQVLQLSNIQHLWTPIYAHLPRNMNPLEIVAQLHPTPAVAGVPTKIACAEILRYETFDRSLYAAPLGWIDAQGNCEFIVGIRSALIEANQAKLYAGAGIVSGSDPEKEFAEIQLKLQSLLNALV